MAVTARIKSWAIRRKMANATWVWDMINLRKTLALCHGCARERMPWRWQQKLHYQEMTRFHGDGHCDMCRAETSVSLYESTETAFWQQTERDHHLVAQTRERERLAITDRRRVH